MRNVQEEEQEEEGVQGMGEEDLTLEKQQEPAAVVGLILPTCLQCYLKRWRIKKGGSTSTFER